MKAKGKFISFLLIVDTFFVAYAYGFHSRQVLVVDPKLSPLASTKEVPKKETNASVRKENLGLKNNSVQAGKSGQAKKSIKNRLAKDETKAVKSSKNEIKKAVKKAGKRSSGD